MHLLFQKAVRRPKTTKPPGSQEPRRSLRRCVEGQEARRPPCSTEGRRAMVSSKSTSGVHQHLRMNNCSTQIGITSTTLPSPNPTPFPALTSATSTCRLTTPRSRQFRTANWPIIAPSARSLLHNQTYMLVPTFMRVIGIVCF